MPEVQVASNPSKAGNLNFDTITDITSSLENFISDNHMLGKGYQFLIQPYTFSTIVGDIKDPYCILCKTEL